MRTTLSRRHLLASTALSLSALATSSCAGAGNLGQGGRAVLNLATVSNPQMKDMEQLRADFEQDHPDIKLNFILMEENDLRDAVTKDMATQGGQYDIVTIGAYEVPIWQQNGWLIDLTEFTEDDREYDVNDFFPPVRESLSVDGHIYAVPFYGESSVLMYNTEIIETAGLEVPLQPTWHEIAELAAQLHSRDQVGICLRGKPGWGEGISSLNTVVNTFGGSWYDRDWNAQVNQQGFRDALTFWSDTIRESAEPDPVSFGFTECLNLFSQGKSAMWYDATSAGGTLEDTASSAVAGKVGYAMSPVEKTDSSGWLWSWNMGIPSTSQNVEAAWTFIRWATNKDYGTLVGERFGWSRVPPGARLTTYDTPEYMKAASSFADITKDSMLAVDPKQPGVTPQPWVGIQYVTIPEWQNLGTQASQTFAEVYAGRKSVDDALAAVQTMAERAGENQR